MKGVVLAGTVEEFTADRSAQFLSELLAQLPGAVGGEVQSATAASVAADIVITFEDAASATNALALLSSTLAGTMNAEWFTEVTVDSLSKPLFSSTLVPAPSPHW